MAGDDEDALQLWLLKRFPGGGTIQERLRRGRWRRVAGFAIVYAAVLWLLPGLGWRRLWDVDEPLAPWMVAAAAGTVLLLVTALVMASRRSTRSGDMSAALRALTPLQRLELGREIRGAAAVVPRDEPALRRLAYRRLVTGRAIGVAAAGLVLGLVPAQVSAPGGVLGAVRVAVLVAVAVVGASGLVRARAASRYLDGELAARAADHEEPATSP
jgi:hypothetical protein